MRGRDLAIVGPTATGKTALAVDVARRWGDAELVSADSMAVYRGLDVGTAKPSDAERAGLVWHCLDLVDFDEEFSVAAFQRAVAAARRAAGSRGRRLVYVGGTGLYHRAAVDGLELAGRYPEVAAALARAARVPGGLDRLYARLQVIDPVAAARIDPSNARRIVRALEVAEGSGRRFSSYGEGMGEYPTRDVTIIGLALSSQVLAARIERRLDAQLAAGFVAEVARIRDSGRVLSRTATYALGYRELLAHVEGRCTLEEARATIVARTKRLARRQLAWFRRDPRVQWLDAESIDLLAQVDERVS